jgi:acetyl esterase/lipase
MPTLRFTTLLAPLLLGCGATPTLIDAGTDAPAVPDVPVITDVPVIPDTPVSCAVTGVRVERDVRYTNTPGVAARLQSLDLYQPTRTAGCAPTPVLIWVHGGGWQTGDKANQMRDKISWATGRSWLLVSVNYRLSPPAPSSLGALMPGRVMYPTHNDDVTAAVQWVRAHAAEYGGDPNNLSLLGHSAGAGIVSQIATNPRFATSPVRCAAVLDTEAYDIAESAGGGDAQGVLYQNAFGSDPAVWREASAMTHVRAGLPGFFVVTRGAPARVSMSRRFVAALSAAGVRNQLVLAQGYDHEGVNDAVGATSDAVITPALNAFLDGCR